MSFIFPDSHLVQFPSNAPIKILTYPNDEPLARGAVNYGIISPGGQGTWIIFFHGMVWLPPKPHGDTYPRINGRSDGVPVQFDDDGNINVNFDPNDHETSQFPECSLMLLRESTDLYILSQFREGRGLIRAPDTQIFAVIRTRAHHEFLPPFAQWNILRQVDEAHGHTFGQQFQQGRSKQSALPVLKELARSIGNATREHSASVKDEWI
ncbi:hypothetical protein F5B19DRAFT_493358 [Rostrohypoxylon terebratum]|nr:hypothetical protein F5B19DRAFT_493358 [Rostrohypoxylon terebratum]